ncbi:MAG: PPC domain-containing protein [Ardenticatenales bacterium]|nr:PPC domain-containing protein [Ardenticatenales bacterium]
MTHGRRIRCALVAVCGLALTAPNGLAAPGAPGTPPDQPSGIGDRAGFEVRGAAELGTRSAVPDAHHAALATGVPRPVVYARGRDGGLAPHTLPSGLELATAAQRATAGSKGAQPMSGAHLAQASGDCSPADLADGTTNGQLADGDCRWGQLTGLPDVSLVDVFRLRLATRQRVRLSGQSAAFAALLSLRDARYAPIADRAAAAEGQAAALDHVLPAGTYLLFVTNAGSGPVATGAYSLSVTLSAEDAPTGCAPVVMTVGGTVTGNLGASGCLGYDYFPRRWFTGDAALYAVQLPTAGVLTLDVAATGHVPPRLAVLTRTGLTTIDATFTETNPAALTELDVHLPAGHFLILVYADAPDQAGAFRLTSSFAPQAAACLPQPAELNTDIVATLDNDCRLAYLNNGSYFNNAADVHALTVPQDGTITIGLETRGFNGHMYILDELNQQIVDGWVDDGFSAQLPPGRFLVAVFAESTAVGGYTLRADFEPLGKACHVQPLGWNTPVDGTIDATDCAVFEFNEILPYDRGLDVYVLDVPARGEIDITLSSTAIDPYLMLFGGPTATGGGLGYFLPSNDDIDSIRDTNARLRFPIWPGRYLVAALDSPFADVKSTGAYRLAATFTPLAAPVCETAVLGLNAELSAELSGTECRAFDRDPRHYSVSHQDRYRIEVPTAGVLTVLMTAPSFSPRIQLAIGPYGDPIGADADPEQVGHQALLQFEAEPGTYWLDAEAVIRTRAITGAYTLQTTFQPRPTCAAVTDLDPLPADRAGQITVDDCVLGDPPLLAQLMSAVDYYRITLKEVGALTIDMSSTTIDPALYLIDARWEIIDANANIDELDANSQLHYDQIRPGTYYIGAISTDPGQFGPYLLRVNFEPSPLDVPTAGPGPSATPITPEPTPPSPTPTDEPGPDHTIYLPFSARLK